MKRALQQIIPALPSFRHVTAALGMLLLGWIAAPVGLLHAQTAPSPGKIVVRVGHFPNITHGQALIGSEWTAAHKGWFEQRLGTNVEVQWFVYNAGPSAMEAMLTRSIDLTYVGATPAINAHLRTEGREVRVISGSCSGGAALVIPSNSPIQKPSDFKGKKVGTPQLGNTQDVAARTWLRAQGFKVILTGGDVTVIPTPNPDQLTLFKQGKLDAVWTVEPWVSRLIREGNGKVFMEEADIWKETQGRYATTLLVSSSSFLTNQTTLVRKFLQAHVELTAWMAQHPDQAKSVINARLKTLTKKELPPEIINNSWKRLEFTTDPMKESVLRCAENTYLIGFQRRKPNLTQLYHLDLIQEVLRSRTPQDPLSKP